MSRLTSRRGGSTLNYIKKSLEILLYCRHGNRELGKTAVRIRNATQQTMGNKEILYIFASV